MDTFVERLGESFELATEAGETTVVTLSSCDAAPHTPPAEWGDSAPAPFSLLFHDSDASRFAPQQTFTVRHPELGEFELFLVPLGPDERGMGYEAVVS